MSLIAVLIQEKWTFAGTTASGNPMKSGKGARVFVHIYATIQEFCLLAGISKNLMINSGITASFQFRAFAVYLLLRERSLVYLLHYLDAPIIHIPQAKYTDLTLMTPF
jgi:hypothetical protein